jgi:hypothetical protein
MRAPPSIAFIACDRARDIFNTGASFIYRCENLAHSLERLGCRVELAHVDRIGAGHRCEAMVFHRPRFSWSLYRAVLLGRLRGATLIGDIDDLVFDPAYAEFSPASRNHQHSPDAVLKRYRRYRRGLGLFNRMTVSTTPLAEHARGLFPRAQVHVVANAVHHGWRTRELPMSIDPDAPRLAYFPGTHSHDRDFSTIAPALEGLFDAHPSVRLRVTGPLNHGLTRHAARIEHHPRVPFEDYPLHFAGVWLNLAPLEETPFNRCKSGLKALEAAYWNIPTLCSTQPDFLRLSGAGALPVDNTAAWLPRLRAMLAPEARALASHGLRARILALADADRFAVDFIDWLGWRDRL